MAAAIVYEAVAVFPGHLVFKMGGGGGVGGGDNRRDHADGLGDPADTKGLVLLDYTAGFGIFISVINIFGGVVVFDHLILHHAHAGFLHGQLGQGDALLVGSDGGRQENAVYLLLGIGGKALLRRAHAGNRSLQLFYAVNDFIIFHLIAHSFIPTLP